MSDATVTSASKSTSGTLRIAGMYSAVDVDGMVKASTTTEQTRIDNQNKKITKQEWINAAYEEINTLISDFKNSFLSATGSNSMTLNSSISTRSVTVSDSSNITITASGNVNTENLEIESFSMATTAAVTSGKMFTNEESKSVLSMTVKDLATKLGINATGTTTKTVNQKDAEGNDVKDAEGNVLTEEITVDTYSFSVNGKELSIDADKSVSDLLAEINGADAGVKASFNSFTGKFSIEATASGTDGKIQIDNTADNLLSGIFANSTDQTGAVYSVGADVTGANAKIKFKGNDEAFESASNKITMDGYTFSLKGDFNTDGSANSPITVKSSIDTETMTNKIKKFTESYNTLMNKLYEYAYTRPDRKYGPLTDSEKEKMTDKQIEEYEEKGKQGILYGDSNIKKLMTNMRRLFTSTKSESGLSFAKIGITTESYTSGSGKWGNVTVDEKKLKSYLETNSDEIVKIFTSTAESSVGTKGIAVQMSDITKTYLNNYKFNISDRLNTKLTNMKELLEKLKDKLATKEDNLYAKFSSMESSMSAINSQSSFLFS